ncbi:MAG: curli-like amyloid fiber formation chaperone CsgH [Burkholderiales bacterium]
MAAEPDISLTLETDATGGTLRVSPRIESGRGRALRYELLSEKTAGASRSSTRQAGRVHANPGQATALTTLSLSLNPGDRYTVTFRLYEDDTLIVERVLVYPRE